MGHTKYRGIVFILVGTITIHLLAGSINAEDATWARPAIVNYQLAWPGVLPDNPLYRLKVLRDRIVLILLTNPVKRLEAYLLYADKDIYAAQLLQKRGEGDLAKRTALTGENYYTMIVDNYKRLYSYHQFISDSLDKKIRIAALKHQEVLEGMINNANEGDKKIFKDVLYFSKHNLEEYTNIATSESGKK